MPTREPDPTLPGAPAWEPDAKYRQLFETMAQGVVYQGADGRILDANPAAERILGLTLAQMQGRTSMDPRWQAMREDGTPLAGEDHPAMVALRTGDAVRGQVMGVFHPEAGRTRWILVDAVPETAPGAGRPHRVFATFTDITALREAQAHASGEARRFDRLFAQAPWHGVLYRLIRDDAGEIVDWELVDINAPGAASLGLERRDLLGKRALDLFGAGVMREYLAVSREVAATGVPRQLETYFASNGRHYLTSVFLVDRDHYANIAIDVTEQKRVEAEKERLQAQFIQAQKMECVGRLAAGVAHDFNNLLMVQRGTCELIAPSVRGDAALSEGVEQILSSVDRAAVLTRQLLAFSRSEAARPVVLDLNQLVLGLGKMLVRLIGEDVSMSTRPAPAPALVDADPGQLEQVLVNLAVNARDAMPGGGRLTVEVSLVDPQAPAAEGAPAGPPLVALTVTDTGTGMDEATQRRLFEPFFTTKPVGKGTGLGLATVHGVVEQCGGSITVDSAPGRGTAFRIELPRVERVAVGVERAERRSDAAPRGGGELVLVVEDEPALRSLMLRLLEAGGYRVAVAPQAQAALRLVEDLGLRPHLLVTDVVMPGMSGPDLVDRLRRSMPSLRVITMSGYAAEMRERLGAAKGVAFLPKPFSQAELLAKVRDALDAR